MSIGAQNLVRNVCRYRLAHACTHRGRSHSGCFRLQRTEGFRPPFSNDIHDVGARLRAMGRYRRGPIARKRAPTQAAISSALVMPPRCR
ncbi:hypothetical protein EIQ00_18360 [Xanthomonas campestris pv. raphani]